MSKKLTVPVPVPDGKKYCHDCKEVKDLGLFPRNFQFKDGRHWRCLDCFSRYNKSRAVDLDSKVWPHPTKFCCRCQREVPVEDFSVDSGARYGLGAYCKSCAGRKQREYRLKNSSRYLKYTRDRRKNQEKKESEKTPKQRADKQRMLELSRLHKLRSYGECDSDFHSLLKAQSGECAICGKVVETESSSLNKLDKATVDHCHEAAELGEYSYRGIICGGCNSGLGFFKDSAETLARAIEYLNKFKSRRGIRSVK